MITEKIETWLSNIDLDVRKSGDARFADQKCTPDVVCFISDCVLNLPGEQLEDGFFTVNDIWQSRYFMKNVKAIFGKPDADEETAANEYDKFIQQPLRLLAYAKILDMEKRGNCNFYRVNNLKILEYIAAKDRNAYNFLYRYFAAVMKASGIFGKFENYKNKCLDGSVTQEDYLKLRNSYIKFIIGHTNINQPAEICRIFPKILNVYAVENGINGSRKGRMTQFPFTYSDLFYNDVNFRDIGKSKRDTRSIAAIEKLKQEAEQREELKYRYEIEKTIALLRKIQSESEVHDNLASGNVLHAHHIFPKHEFPIIAAKIENLIMLTPSQHYTLAHNGNTASINKNYQLTCLLAKSNTIENSIAKGEPYYSKSDFIDVINTGLASSLPYDLEFMAIRRSVKDLHSSFL